MNAFQLDFWMQVQTLNVACAVENCGHTLSVHDTDAPLGTCTVRDCPCVTYSPKRCAELCSKPLGHSGPHYLYRP